MSLLKINSVAVRVNRKHAESLELEDFISDKIKIFMHTTGCC